MKKILLFDERPSAEVLDSLKNLTRDDLDPEEAVIYDGVLPKLANPDAEHLRMLAAYAYAASEMKKASKNDNQRLAVWARECMIYARNQLGIAPPRFVDLMGLLCDEPKDCPPITFFLDSTWQLQR